MFYLRTSHMHNMPANVPKPTAPRPSLYARDKVVFTLRPFGRKPTASIPPPVPDLHRVESKRNRLGGLAKSVTAVFRKDKADKFKETASNNIKPLSSGFDLNLSGVAFNTSEKFGRSGCHDTAGLDRGSKSADALHELIDAHSGRDLGLDSFSSLGDILAESPDVPTSSPISTQYTDRLVSPSEVSDGFVIDGKVISADGSAGPHHDSVSDKTKRDATPMSFFEGRPLSGEFNRMDVFKRISAMIQKPRIRPLRLASKLRESMMPGSDNVNPTPVQVNSMQESPVSSLPPIPDLIVTNYDDSTMIVVKLDEDEEPTEYIDPGFLHPGYVRERYPGIDQYTGASYLTLSTSDRDIGLHAIEEEDEEVVDSYSPNDTSDSSYVDITPSDGQYVDAPRLTHSTNGWAINLQAMEEEDEEALGSDWSNVTEPELELANDSSYIQDCYPPNSYNPDIPRLTHSTSGPNITLEATGEEDEEAVGSYLPDDSELDLERASDSSCVQHSYPGDGLSADAPCLTHSVSGWNLSSQAIGEEAEETVGSYSSDDIEELASDTEPSSPEVTHPAAPTSVSTPLLAPTTQKRWLRPLRLVSRLRDLATLLGSNETNPTRVQSHPIQESLASAPSPVPVLIVTSYDDNITTEAKLDEVQEPTHFYVTPGFLFPGYVRQRYPSGRQYADAPQLTLSMSGWSVDLQGIYEEVKERVGLFSPEDSEPDLEPASDSTSSSPESTPPRTPTSVDMPLLAPAFSGLPLGSILSKSWIVIDEDELGDDAFGIAL
ncbi:hypothetical protein FRC08_003960 [Ceratobasidium sp. 394]|nr:hypothetical protein FRC08_003960 [Ceratobasidium sp. 394]